MTATRSPAPWQRWTSWRPRSARPLASSIGPACGTSMPHRRWSRGCATGRRCRRATRPGSAVPPVGCGRARSRGGRGSTAACRVGRCRRSSPTSPTGRSIVRRTRGRARPPYRLAQRGRYRPRDAVVGRARRGRPRPRGSGRAAPHAADEPHPRRARGTRRVTRRRRRRRRRGRPPAGHDPRRPRCRRPRTHDFRTAGRRAGRPVPPLPRHHRADSPGRNRPHLNVIVRHEDIEARGQGRLLDGTPLDATTTQRLLCDADLHRLVVTGRSTVLDYGRRTRTISPELFAVLAARDGHCRAPGCDRRHRLVRGPPRRPLARRRRHGSGEPGAPLLEAPPPVPPPRLAPQTPPRRHPRGHRPHRPRPHHRPTRLVAEARVRVTLVGPPQPWPRTYRPRAARAVPPNVSLSVRHDRPLLDDP